MRWKWLLFFAIIADILFYVFFVKQLPTRQILIIVSIHITLISFYFFYRSFAQRNYQEIEIQKVQVIELKESRLTLGVRLAILLEYIWTHPSLFYLFFGVGGSGPTFCEVKIRFEYLFGEKSFSQEIQKLLSTDCIQGDEIKSEIDDKVNDLKSQKIIWVNSKDPNQAILEDDKEGYSLSLGVLFLMFGVGVFLFTFLI